MRYVGFRSIGRDAALIFVASLVSASLDSSVASANAGVCTLSGSTLTCGVPIPCATDAECYANGRARCVVGAGGGTAGMCAPDCSSVFTCMDSGDCPAIGGLTPSCQPTSIRMVVGLCEYHDPVGRSIVTYCGSGFVSLANVVACVGPGGRWDTGDCDGDMLLNGTDASPCVANPTGPSLPRVPWPFCLAGHLCEGLSNVCAPFLHCDPSGSDCAGVGNVVGATGPWECSPLPGRSELFCHPSCNATAHCTAATAPSDCGFSRPCRMATASVSMCVLPTLIGCTCVASATNPLDWATGQGDCDGDTAQNGCDPNACAGGDATCFYNHICAIDAGMPDSSVMTNDASNVDGGVNNVDGGVTTTESGTADASVTSDASVTGDGARTMDATTAADAGTGFDASGRGVDANAGTGMNLGFGGGGGCRCALIGGHRESTLAGSIALGWLAIALARRRRRAV